LQYHTDKQSIIAVDHLQNYFMIKYHKTIKDTLIAELNDNKLIITQTQDILDLIGDLVANDCQRIIIHERNLHPDFFQLKSGLAGDILQKFSNYKVRLAIIGDFSKYKSKSLHDLIRECNKGTMIFFIDTWDSAIAKLTPKIKI
jgi:hypothetical protein